MTRMSPRVQYRILVRMSSPLRCTSTDVACVAAPVRCAQFLLEYLAGGVTRQRSHEFDTPRQLVAAQVTPAMRDQLLARQGRALLEHDHRQDGLPELRVRYADHGRVGDRGMGEQH